MVYIICKFLIIMAILCITNLNSYQDYFVINKVRLVLVGLHIFKSLRFQVYMRIQTYEIVVRSQEERQEESFYDLLGYGTYEYSSFVNKSSKVKLIIVTSMGITIQYKYLQRHAVNKSYHLLRSASASNIYLLIHIFNLFYSLKCNIIINSLTSQNFNLLY